MNIVRELRKKKGIQQKELALAIGVSQPAISDWEKNKSDPSGERLKKLAEYFGVDELFILGYGMDNPSLLVPTNPKVSGVSETKQILQYLLDKLNDQNDSSTQDAQAISGISDNLQNRPSEAIAIKPNYEKAAVMAAKILVQYKINTAPISSLPIFLRTPGVLVLSYSDISNEIGISHRNITKLFGLEYQDAVTSISVDDGNLKYLVAYNQQLPYTIVQRALARELGHIVLQHDDSMPIAVREAEAKAFAKHLLCPRALIHTLQEAGSILTVEAVGSVTGCYGRCISYMRTIPGTHVPASLNRQIKEQFADYAQNFVDYQSILIQKDTSPLADFGTFMDGYEE